MMGAAADYFYHSDNRRDTLNKRVRPSDEQMAFLRENKNALKTYLEQDMRQRCGYPVSTWLQGSYKLHTLIRPIYGGEYDVDLGVYVEWGDSDDPLTPLDLREHAQDSLIAFANTNAASREVEEPAKQRCSRIKYEQNFHIDTPIYHHNTGTSVARLATLNDDWESSDPEKMVTWFQERLEGDERAQARRLTRYMKAWAALRFASDAEARPSSLLLSVLCVDAYIDAVNCKAMGDDDALLAVVEAIHERVSENSRVPNPVSSDQDDNLNRLSEQGNRDFLAAIGGLAEICRRANSEEDEGDAVAVWTDAFDFLLPLPDTEGLAEANLEKTAIVAAPNIAIEVLNSQGTVLRNYQNEVELTRIGERLRFRIVNPQVLPFGVTVRWVVRNTGDHAYSANDLGHSKTDNGKLIWTENVAYRGRHFMDCEVRLGGRIRSITRVPVNVSALPSPVRHRRRPAYTVLNRRR
jgi:hypothetical protein